jgi:hypothetical protein
VLLERIQEPQTNMEASAQSPPAAFELQNWPSTPSWVANNNRLWQDPLEVSGSLSGLSPGPLFPNSPDQYGSSFAFDIGHVSDATSSTANPNLSLLSGIEHLSETDGEDLSLQLFRGSRNQLSHGVLYNDTHHKFSPVLSLCKLTSVGTRHTSLLR